MEAEARSARAAVEAAEAAEEVGAAGAAEVAADCEAWMVVGVVAAAGWEAVAVVDRRHGHTIHS